jgi:hypothetical protein
MAASQQAHGEHNTFIHGFLGIGLWRLRKPGEQRLSGFVVP